MEDAKILTNVNLDIVDMEAVQNIQEVSSVVVLMVLYREKEINNVKHVQLNTDQENLMLLICE